MNPRDDQAISDGHSRPPPSETTAGMPVPQGGGFCEIARVCTWRKNAAVELRVSEARYRALYENSFDGVVLTQPAGRILAANPAACRILGRTEAQLQTLNRMDLVKPGDPRAPMLIAEREKTGRYQGELTLVRGDGSTFEAELTSVVFATEQHGTITSVIVRDVSERKRAEARVKEQAQWLDKVSEAIFVTDLDHRITFWNQGAERMGGWTAGEMVGQDIGVLLQRIGIFDPQVRAASGQVIDWRGTVSCHHRNGCRNFTSCYPMFHRMPSCRVPLRGKKIPSLAT